MSREWSPYQDPGSGESVCEESRVGLVLFNGGWHRAVGVSEKSEWSACDFLSGAFENDEVVSGNE